MSTFDNNSEQASATETGKPAAYCQNCGKPLDQESMRVVGPAVYCESCLAARLSGAPETAPGTPPTAAWAAGTWTPKSAPNPALAGLLGIIPGVGAMYNEQYAKGLFHLVIFVVLVNLSHAISGIFVLFTIGWVFYMAIEAHHTARARRDGTPLPNPFGLNELGERLGFNKTWPTGQPSATAPTGAAYAPPASGYVPPVDPAYGPVAGGGYVPPVAPPYGQPVYGQQAGTWGAPAEGYDPAAAYAAGQATSPYGQSYGPTYGTGYVPPVANPYGVPYAPIPPIPGVEPAFVPRANRFPAGAVWLIGLGTVFLLSTTGVFHVLFGWTLVGFVLIGLAVWIFLRKMMDTGASIGNDGTAGYPLRIVRALGFSVWLFTVGVLLLADEYDVVPWRRSWPLFIILAGVMALLQRAAYNSAAASAYEAAQVAATPVPTAAAGNPYSIVPSSGASLSRTDEPQNARNDEGAL